MKLKLSLYRTAMIGGGNHYEVLVDVKSLPSRKLSKLHHFVLRDNRTYCFLVSALMPESHYELEPGIERWEAYKRWEKVAAKVAYDLCSEYFHELKQLGTLPELWAFFERDFPSAQIDIQKSFDPLPRWIEEETKP